VDVANYPLDSDLPETGGAGRFIYILCGMIFTVTPLVYGFSLRRRHERRLKR
jgi:hypothetical protein